MTFELLDLPNELLSHIFSFLDATAPSRLTAKDHPQRPQVTTTGSVPLKHVSTLSQRLRKIALPHLFRYITLSQSDVSQIITFTSAQNLAVHVSSAQIYLPGPSSHHRPLWWTSILDHFPNLIDLDVIAPPHVFAEITQCPIKVQDAWAFKVALQRFQLSCEPSLYTPSSEPSSPPSSSLLTARPWTTLHVNESSSLPAYTTYEYFLRTPPCPLPSASTLLTTPSSHQHPLRSLLQTLRSFHFTAIFPTYNHVAEITGLIEAYMHNLETLTFQLLPKPESTILQDTLEATGNHIDVNDPWNEFETSLLLVARVALALSSRGSGGDGGGSVTADGIGTQHTVGNDDANVSRTTGGKLKELRIEDVAMAGIRDTIEERITKELTDKPEYGWTYEGGGIWRRQVSPVTSGVDAT